MDKVTISKLGVDVTYQDETLQSSFAELDQAIQANAIQEPFIYPPSCRYHERDREMDLFVLEQQPKVVNVKWRVRFDDREYESTSNWQKPRTDYHDYAKIALSIPYLIIVPIFRRGRILNTLVYFRKAPLTSLEDDVLHAPLLNVNYAGVLCSGDIGVDDTDYMKPRNESLYSILRKLEGSFWRTSFNYDMGKGILHQVPEAYPAMRWAEETYKDPQFGMKVNWPSRGIPLRATFDYLKQSVGWYSSPPVCETYVRAALNMSYLHQLRNEKQVI